MKQYVYPSCLVPDNDRERLNSLWQCNILDTPEDASFDRIAHMAALIFNTPSAFINFVDADSVFFKSNLSTFPTRKVARKDSLCSLTILQQEPTVFEDTHQVPELLQSPYVNVAGGIRFYAGAPLIMPDGHRIGTVCVIDEEPRLVTKRQMNMLVMLSEIVVEKLVLESLVSQLQYKLQLSKSKKT